MYKNSKRQKIDEAKNQSQFNTSFEEPKRRKGLKRPVVGVHSISSTEDEENLIDENETPWLTKPSNIKGNRTNSRMNLPSPPPVQYRFKNQISPDESDFAGSEAELASLKLEDDKDVEIIKIIDHCTVPISRKNGVRIDELEKQNQNKLEFIPCREDFSESDPENPAASQIPIPDSDDSDYEEQVQILSECRCLQVLNDSNLTEVRQHFEKFDNDEFIEFLSSKRPFRTLRDLETKLKAHSVKLSKLQLVHHYLKHLESMNVVNQILIDCQKISKSIEKELGQLKNNAVDPSNLIYLSSSQTLLPHQIIGLNWLIIMDKLKLNSILADEMGLGKTVQIIAFLAWAKQNSIKGPHLIIVPSSTFENWMIELDKWAPELSYTPYYGNQEERRYLRHDPDTKKTDLILTTYNMVISKEEDRKFFRKFSINYIIYDEGHMLRNCTTQRYLRLMSIQGKRKILLTGTPLQNNLSELISLLYFIMPERFNKYCDGIDSLLRQFTPKQDKLLAENTTSDKFYDQSKIERAKTILKPYVLRRLKEQELKLPEKHDRTEFCALNEVQRMLYADLIEQCRERSNGAKKMAFYMDLFTQMRQVSNHPLLYRRHYNDDKVTEMAKILCIKEKFYEKKNPDDVAEELAFKTDIDLHSLCKKYQSINKFALNNELSLESEKCKFLDSVLPEIIDHKQEKVLIFSQFTSLLDILELYMECRGYKFLRLDGSTKVMERQDLIDEFNQDPSIPVFFLSTKAGGLGINLTAANHVIIHDIDYNPHNDRQAESRCHRMGQQKEVYVYRLIAKGTIEENMLRLADMKLALDGSLNSEEDGSDANYIKKLLDLQFEEFLNKDSKDNASETKVKIEQNQSYA